MLPLPVSAKPLASLVSRIVCRCDLPMPRSSARHHRPAALCRSSFVPVRTHCVDSSICRSTPGKHPLILILHGSGGTLVMRGDGGFNRSYDEMRAAFRAAGIATADLGQGWQLVQRRTLQHRHSTRRTHGRNRRRFRSPQAARRYRSRTHRSVGDQRGRLDRADDRSAQTRSRILHRGQRPRSRCCDGELCTSPSIDSYNRESESPRRSKPSPCFAEPTRSRVAGGSTMNSSRPSSPSRRIRSSPASWGH